MEKFNGRMCPVSIDDAETAFDYQPEVSGSSSFVYGVEQFKESLKESIPQASGVVGGLLYKAGKEIDKYFPDGIKLFNGSVDVKIADKLKKGGEILVNAADRNVEAMQRKFRRENPRLEKAQENLMFDIGNQGANWTTMLLSGRYAGYVMGNLVLGGEFQERADKYKQEHGGSLEGFAQEYGDEAGYNLANAFVQGVEERYLGSYAQVKSIKKGMGFVKAIGKNAVQEGFIEEPLQDVTDFYFDKLTGFNENEELKDRLKGNLRGYVVASLFGGAGGFGAAVYQRAEGIDYYKEALKNTVPEKDLEKVATKAYEQDAKTLRDIVTVEIENSSSLENKRGEVYENMYKATIDSVNRARKQGGYADLRTEEEVAAYAKAEADNFANWVLEEANRRNTTIQNVLDASSIYSDETGLHIGMTRDTVSEQTKFTSNRGTYSESYNIYYQFAGENAQTAALDELDRAKQLEADSVGNEEIRQQTGWFKGVDNIWRFEISDKDAKFKDVSKMRFEKTANVNGDIVYRIKLVDLLEHEKLFQAYPFLRNIEVIATDEKIKSRDYLGLAYPDKIFLNSSSIENQSEGRRVLLHEIQHLIQTYEDFAQGGGPSDASAIKETIKNTVEEKSKQYVRNKLDELVGRNASSDIMVNHRIYVELSRDSLNAELNAEDDEKIKELNRRTKEAKQDFEESLQKAGITREQFDKIQNEARNLQDWTKFRKVKSLDDYEIYKRIAGEIEARNVEKRADMTEEQRRAESPESTQDVANADAIVIFDDGTAMAYGPETYYQRGKATRGSIQFKGQEAIIRLTESANASTLAHELAHYYLQNTFLYSKSGLASPEYSTYFKPIADYLGIDSNQETIKEWQQEKFARAYEQYLLKGKAETPELQAAFNNYNKWIKRAYRMLKSKPKYRNEEGKLVEPRLTPEIMEAFGKLTGGFVARPDIEAMAETVTPELENAVVEYENQVTQEQERIQKETVYPTTEIRETAEEGATGKSGVAFRVLGEELGYDVKHIEDQMEKAREFVRKNLSEAKEIVNGKQAPEGMLSSAINLAYVEIMENSGNYQEAERATRIRSMEQTRRGQEIAMEKATTDNILNAETWSNLVLSRKSAEAARKYFKNDLKALQDFIKRESANIAKQIASKPKEERASIIRENLERITQETGILFQEDYSDLEDSDYYNEVLNETQLMIEKSMGIGLDEDQIDYIHDNVRQLQDIVKETVSNNGNISIEAFKQIRKMYDTIESYTPSSNVAVWSSIIGRGAMLASVKSPILNIISNAENMITETLSRKVLNIVTGQSNDNIVDSNIINDYLKWSYNVYQASGYMPSVTSDILGGRPILGEKRLTSQGQGKVRAIGRFAEDIVFKELMGLPDSISKDLNFVSVAGNKATQQAYKEGLKGDKAKARANELFKDAILLRPMTEEGENIRNESMAAAHEATFTQDSEISKIALRIRDVLNSKEFKAGDFLVPFVKTPANVVALGMEYSLGSIYTVYHIKDIINNPQSDVSQAVIKAGVRNGLGIILAMMLAGLVDDDDYIPEYDNASPKQRDIAKLKNAPFNSIRIGNKWINLDYFGPLAIPMAGILTARAKQDLTGFLQGVSGQALKTPGVKEINSLIGDVTRAVQYGVSYKKIAEDVFNWGVEQTASRTIPAIITDFGKLIDKYERETGGEMARRIMAKIPVLREELPIKTDITGRKIETESTNILFGSRVKTAVDDAVVKEIDRLNKAGNAPTISDPTRYGYFRSLETEEKDKIRAKFNQEYGRMVREKIASSAYKRLDDSKKKKELNKIRKKISDDLKKGK